MFKSLKGALHRRLTTLQENTTLQASHEMLVKEFISGIFGPEAVTLIQGIFYCAQGELIITTHSKVLASELTIRKEALIEYLKDKKLEVVSLRIQ